MVDVCAIRSSGSLSADKVLKSTGSEKATEENGRKLRGKEVPSRYLSRSPSVSSSTTSSSSSSSFSKRRFSPFRTPLASEVKRSQSVDRKRISSSVSKADEMSIATKTLVTYTKSLSVSFQGEAFSFPISKSKATTPKSMYRKMTSTKVQHFDSDGHGELSAGVKDYTSKSSNHSNNTVRSEISSGKSAQQALVRDDARKSIRDLSCTRKSYSSSLNGFHNSDDVKKLECDNIPSVKAMESGDVIPVEKKSSRGMVTSAKLWQETNNRIRKFQDTASTLSPTSGSKVCAATKDMQPRRISTDHSLGSQRVISESPVRSATKLSSPNKLCVSPTPLPSRGNASPASVRPVAASCGNTLSVLSFIVDSSRGRLREDQIAYAHALRLLYNRYFQWRFVNAQSSSIFLSRRSIAERSLRSVSMKISELWQSVILKRTKLLLQKQRLKLASIVTAQIRLLEEWRLLERVHAGSLNGTAHALKTSSLCLPVMGVARVDIKRLYDVFCSAVDLMQSIATSISFILDKVERMNLIVSELLGVEMKEQALLKQCKDLLSAFEALQVKECCTHHLLTTTKPIL